MEFIRIRDVEKTYPTGVTALYGLNLEIKKGDFVFIIGASGSGKSTLMKMLYREEKASNGEIIIGGVKVGKLKNRKVYKLRRKLGVVFQDFKLLPKLTAYENVAFVLEMFGYDKNEIRKKTLKALDLVGLKEKAKSYPHELSGGEQQRVAIARAIAKNPKLLLCDEPTGALDYKTGKSILKLLQEMARSENMTVIIITHNAAITPMADKVIRFKNGKAESVETNANPISIDNIEW